MKKVIAFDLDGTLAPSKSAVPDRVLNGLSRLLDNFEVCVISGGKFEQFYKQFLTRLKADDSKLSKLHIMPACGTQYYQFNVNTKEWTKIYSEDFTNEQKAKIRAALEEGLDHFGYRADKVYGEIIEDRGSQVTLSTLGQNIVDKLGEEGIRLKEEWDPDNAKNKT